MNINYDEIITKANERAEKLKAIQEYACFVEENANALLLSLKYFQKFGKLVAELDPEGRQIIVPLFYRIARISSLAESTLGTYTIPNSCNGSDESVLSALVKELK